jgi:hypothetical protein
LEQLQLPAKKAAGENSLILYNAGTEAQPVFPTGQKNGSF